MDCVFCKIINGEIPSVKVYENDHILAFLDINPMEKGHVLVIPKQHWPSLPEVPVDDSSDVAMAEELYYMVRVIAKACIRSFADGANILQCNGEAAGQTVFHLHFHVIPRYKDSSHPLSFDSGHAHYDSDEERAQYAEKLRTAIAKILAEEKVL